MEVEGRGKIVRKRWGIKMSMNKFFAVLWREYTLHILVHQSLKEGIKALGKGRASLLET